MSGDWIKMRKSLLTDPRVIRISSALKADRLRTIGGLFSAWCLLDEQTIDGHLSGYSPEIFDEIVFFPGLARQMAAVGWLEIKDGEIVATEFSKHNGQSAKKRAQDSVRKMSAREADKTRTDSGQKADQRREEKRIEEREKNREENRIKDTHTNTDAGEPRISVSARPQRTRRPSVAIGLPHDITESHWRDWTACRRKPVTESVMEGLRREAAKAGITADEAVQIAAERQWEGFKAEWLNNDRTIAVPERKPAPTQMTFGQMKEKNRNDVFERAFASGKVEAIFDAAQRSNGDERDRA